MKRKYFLLGLVLVLVMFLVGCGGGIPTVPNQSPTANFTANPTSGIAPLEVAFDASNSSDSDGSITSYQWDFKDGNTGTGETANHTFSSIGSYNVNLTVTDNDGATDSTTKTITVTETTNQSPVASFTANPTSGIAPLEVAFDASNSSDSDGSITSYAWDFKDGNTGNGETVNHTFSSTGNYNVKLTVTDDKGATSSATKTITVTETTNQAPIITSTPITTAIVGLLYTYDVDATDPDGDILTYSFYSIYTKPNGMTINSTTGVISWTPNTTGDYDVTVQVSDGYLIDTQSFTIQVNIEEVPPPIEAWSYLLNVNDPVYRGNNRSAVALNIKNPIDGQNHENLIFKIIINDIDIEDSLWTCAFTFTDPSSGTTAKFSNWGTAEEGYGWVGYWKGPAGNGFSLPVSSNNTFIFDLYCGLHASFGSYNITFQLIDQNNIIIDSATTKTSVVGPVVIVETLSNELKRGSNPEFLTVEIQNPAFSRQYNGYLYFVIYPEDEGLPLFEEYFSIQSSLNQQNGGQPVIPSPWCGDGDGGYWYGDWGTPGFNIETSYNLKITFDIDVAEQIPSQDIIIEVLLEVPEDGWVAGDYKIVSVK